MFTFLIHSFLIIVNHILSLHLIFDSYIYSSSLRIFILICKVNFKNVTISENGVYLIFGKSPFCYFEFDRIHFSLLNAKNSKKNIFFCWAEKIRIHSVQSLL